MVPYDFMSGAELDQITRKEGRKKVICCYRWFTAAPLREDRDALKVNWIVGRLKSSQNLIPDVTEMSQENARDSGIQVF
jgi:hypothetical protein